MKKILGFLICSFFTNTSLYAKDIDYIGTPAKPIPLKSSGPGNQLEPLTLYLYQDKSFTIMEQNIVLFNGTFTDEGDSISFSDHIAYANKMYISQHGDNITCLQTILYKPKIYAYKSDWFCPAKGFS